MKTKRFGMRILIMALVFRMTVVECDLNPADNQNAYTEGDVYIEGMGFGFNPPIKNAPYSLQPPGFPSQNLKNEMARRGVDWSGMVYLEAGVLTAVINKKVGNN